MKKALILAGTFLTAILTGLQAAAQSNIPATGERVSIMPYILAIVAIILIAALSWLTYLSRKNKK